MITISGTAPVVVTIDGEERPLMYNIPDNGGGLSGLEYEEGTFTPEEDVASPTIEFANTHTKRPFYVCIADTSETIAETNSAYMFAIINWYDLFGIYIEPDSGQQNYARTVYMYKTSSSYSTSGIHITALEGEVDSAMPYYLTETGFRAYLGGGTRYFRAGRTYKWVAVWAPETE